MWIYCTNYDNETHFLDWAELKNIKISDFEQK